MIGLARAEWLRLRKRRSVQVIVLAVPLLVAVTMIAGYHSTWEPPPFDAEAYRQELIDTGYVAGLPPEDAEPLLAEAVESYRVEVERMREGSQLVRASFSFPYSLAMALGTGTFVMMALILLTATTIGDEFGWATIRTSLLASSDRRSFLAVRLAALVAAGAVIIGLLLLVAVLAPLVLAIPRESLPAALPAFDFGALLALLGGELIAAVAVVGFATTVTLLLRSGALTLVAALVWVAIEAAILTLLMRFPNFAGTYTDEGAYTPGPDTWLLEAFPLRGLTTLMQAAGRAASGLPSYPGEIVTRDTGAVVVPIVSLAVMAVVFVALALRRAGRMDIVE